MNIPNWRTAMWNRPAQRVAGSLWKALMTIVICFGSTSLMAQSSLAQPMFPLAKGTYWVYEGNVTYQLTPNQTTTATIRRRMQVQEVVSGADFLAAKIKGGPWDLEFYSANEPSGDYLIVSSGDAIYLAQDQQAVDLFAQLQASGWTHELHDALAEGIWFRVPLRANGIYCPPDQLARVDRMYCWAVTDEKTKHIAGIAGLKAATKTVYELAFNTNPDHQIVEIAPGIGMLHFVYGHHGTPSAADVRLVEFHAGK